MKLSFLNLKSIVKQLNDFLKNKRISEIKLVNSRLFLFYLKKCDYQLLVDLDNNRPLIGLIKSDYDELSLPNDFIAQTKKCGSPNIHHITTVNNDKIVKIVSYATDAYYHRNEYRLYIELINAHANMILTDQNDKILAAFYQTNLLAPRVIVKGQKYVLPEKKNEEIKNEEFSYEKYLETLKIYFNEALEKRKKELYSPYIKKHEKAVKSLNKKIEKINESINKAKDHIRYKEMGEILLMNIASIKRGDNYYQNIKLDPTKDAISNANIYFDKYKKAKRTLVSANEILKKSLDELEEENYYLDALKHANEEEVKMLVNPSNNRSFKEVAPKYLPYVISYQGVNYYIGHNALENDYLTFKMFKKSSNVIWMHLKDQPSSHLIINKANPSNEELDLAASILLLKSHLTTGEIMYSERKNITRGNTLAKVNVLNYKSITMRKINPLAINLLKREKKAHE